VNDGAEAGFDGGLFSLPDEDRGHETALWFGYQYACTVQECLRMLIEPIRWVLCEWHTDFVCSGIGGLEPFCLVSVKHRRPDQGQWSISDLSERGGLKTLYKRWVASNRKHSCRMMTNGGFKVGKDQGKALLNVLDRGSEGDDFHDEVEKYAKLLCPGLEAESDADAQQFLYSLKLVTTSADEHSMIGFLIEQVARPTLSKLGLNVSLARALCRATNELVQEAVFGLDPRTPNVNWMVGRPQIDATRNRRLITRERLVDKLNESGIPITSDLLPESSLAKTVMIRKLNAGNLGPTVMRSAPRLRRRWYELEVSFRADMPGSVGDEVRRLRAEVTHRAGIAENNTRVPGGHYGPEMHTALSELLADSNLNVRVPAGPPELMGCAYQLTDECLIWWSDIFDLGAEVDRPNVRGWANIEERDEGYQAQTS
jgi:hypothetical protein